MSYLSEIQWCDHTWPVTSGCEKVSPGCAKCYAILHSWRLAHNPHPAIAAAYEGTVERAGESLQWTGEVMLLEERLGWPLKWKKPAKIFVGNMSDIFHVKVTADFLERVFEIIKECPQHTFQVLTKRPELALIRFRQMRMESLPRNVWFGVSVENEPMAKERLSLLRQIGERYGAVTFVSYEPALGPVEWEKHGVVFDWLICGGESDYDARRCDVDDLRQAAAWADGRGVKVFVKQLGSNAVQSGLRVRLKHKKGGDPAEWPDDLRVREFPR